MEPLYRKTYIEIDNKAIEENAALLTRNYPHKYNIAVIKGNAYGHGYGIVPALLRGGMNAFAVSRLDEAMKIREYDTEHPIIMLQPVHSEFYALCSTLNISICIVDLEAVEDVLSSGLPLKVQIKVDCGMNRLGFKDKEQLNEAVSKFQASENVVLEGIFTHFHTSGRIDNEYKLDKARFEELTSDIDLAAIPMVHCDRTQTAILHDSPAYETGARFGIALFGFSTVYGYSAGLKGRIRKLQFEVNRKLKDVDACKPYSPLHLKKAFNVYTEVIQVKKALKGEYVGYGLMHKAEKDEYVATIDIGYADGMGRRRFNTPVAINGKLYTIIGDIGMGMCEVLVDETVRKHDKVTVFGGIIPSTSITSKLETTIYEAMTNYDSSIPRIYVD